MKTIFIILIAFLTSSCAIATVQYDAETGSFYYQRWGKQELIDLHVTKSLDEVNVDLGGQKSKHEITEVLNGLQENVKKALKILDDIQKKVPGVF